MKKSRFIIAFLCFIGFAAFSQTKGDSSITGTLTEVHSFNEQYAITVGNTTLVLIVDRKDKIGGFEINKEYLDILIKKEGKYVLNPKYANKSFDIEYYINGKGWKCIRTIKPSGK